MSIQRVYYFQRSPTMYQNSLATNNGHPRELYIAKAAENCGFSLVVPIISRTPTMLISPFSTLKNCGNSSRLVTRMKLPMPVFFVPSGRIFTDTLLGKEDRTRGLQVNSRTHEQSDQQSQQTTKQTTGDIDCAFHKQLFCGCIVDTGCQYGIGSDFFHQLFFPPIASETFARFRCTVTPASVNCSIRAYG